MPNRLSKILARSSKEKEAEAEAERDSSNGETSSPPPAYDPQAPDYDADNVIDPPDVTAGFNNLNLNEQSGDIPQVSECIAHLKVLECFYRLRQKVGSTDGLFGIYDKVILEQGLAEKENSELLAKFAEKRWAIYVSRAVDRFETWSASLFPSAQMAKTSELEKLGKEDRLCHGGDPKSTLKFSKDNMPPADVLMVWHAYMLNPRAYLEDCLRLCRMGMWHAGFPWRVAVDCIDSETFAYNAGEEAEKAFTGTTGLLWNNLDDIGPKHISCPSCGTKIDVLFTTCTDYAPKPASYSDSDRLSRAIDSMLAQGTGFCDKDFSASCNACKAVITHDRLRAKKFCSDVRLLLERDVPMGGTLLGIKGLPWKFNKETDYQCNDTCSFPNNLLRSGLGKEIVNKPAHSTLDKTMDGIRKVVEAAIRDRLYLRRVPGVRAMRLSRTQRIGIRRVMSRYWENSSPFALDLVGAVIRQGSFIEKMHNIDWLHSPALPSTMKRLLVKYQRFVSIMADRSHMAVPTLDVDLAWHTHQLSPYTYMKHTVQQTKQFIDHDDKVAETKLNDAFAWTSKTYQKTYGEPYSECTCWYCEAIRESHTSAASRLFRSSNGQAEDQLHDAVQDPRKSVHISAHNAVRPTDYEYARNAASKAEMLEKQYQRACDRARKNGRPIPRRNDYYYSDAWGYPVYIPAYSPYLMFAAYTPMYYPVTPGCMALGAGAYGNCCSGTCGGAVAAGSCGGGGGAACAGGVGGGCAGGAGGCGGGGGGCGGGGGGGGGCGGGGGGG